MCRFSVRKQETTINQTEVIRANAFLMYSWQVPHELKPKVLTWNKKKPQKTSVLKQTWVPMCKHGHVTLDVCVGGAEQARILSNQVWLLTPSCRARVRKSHRTFKTFPRQRDRSKAGPGVRFNGFISKTVQELMQLECWMCWRLKDKCSKFTTL